MLPTGQRKTISVPCTDVGPGAHTRNTRGQQMPSPPGHLWRDKWTALSGPLSKQAKQALEVAGKEAKEQANQVLEEFTRENIRLTDISTGLSRPLSTWALSGPCAKQAKQALEAAGKAAKDKESAASAASLAEAKEMKAAGEAGIKAATDKVIINKEVSVENSLSQPGLQPP